MKTLPSKLSVLLVSLAVVALSAPSASPAEVECDGDRSLEDGVKNWWISGYSWPVHHTNLPPISQVTGNRPTVSTLAPATTPVKTTPHSTASRQSPPQPSFPPLPSTTNSVVRAYLKSHNQIRAAHAAAPLTWSDALAHAAQSWANKCQTRHSGGSLGFYGENLAWGPVGFNATQAIDLWTAERSQYNPRNPQMSHFTQVVWRNTSKLGCASAVCPRLLNNNAGTLYVCEYDPPGNWAGQYSQNVII